MQWIVGVLAGQYFMERLLVESSRTVNAHGRVDAVEGTREGHSVMTLLPSMGRVLPKGCALPQPRSAEPNPEPLGCDRPDGSRAGRAPSRQAT
jgi:hypothetical protein